MFANISKYFKDFKDYIIFSYIIYAWNYINILMYFKKQLFICKKIYIRDLKRILIISQTLRLENPLK